MRSELGDSIEWIGNQIHEKMSSESYPSPAIGSRFEGNLIKLTKS